ncbi:nuclear hormone receptor HR96 [Toxorhynchites rutilus septentrionalis]|uniref:nuclear hormone receptor HR96 n=1 Tax=Toxorhynchites rutilus septentrionalis TaxID=329112 RepID=UPI00247906A3|nr:nuclear hormone receptor HR96 [Toxorhynchites rutilus septentrionalis]XP_055626445.1 nuclear hormone receptor HR96 [Toxorhynchites rutilus septentrionalis]
MSAESSDTTNSVDTMAQGGANNKICSVCGDKALGYNFNAMTCESCKAFFRRNALSTKGFTCPFNEVCEITVVTRRFCQKCRLDKCFQVGMKKEYIMSEEDKALKRKKIEQNRAKKRKANDTGAGGNSVQHESGEIVEFELPTKIKREGNDSDSWSNSPSDYASVETMHQTASSMQNLTVSNMNGYNSVPLSNEMCSPSPAMYDAIQTHSHGGESSSPSQPGESIFTTNNFSELPQSVRLTVDSSPEDIVNRIVNYPTQASQTIATLMKTPKDAVFIMSKIINSQCDALKLISHFITAPGDALQIISKIMNSPLDALTVFAQFMSSPTDALQIIGKIMSSPADVLLFMQQLMNQPEDAVQIMNKFMSSPAEALHMINKMMNHSEVIETIKEAADTSHFDEEDQLDVVPPKVPSSEVPHPNPASGASPSSTSFCEPTFSTLDPFFTGVSPEFHTECAPQNSDLSFFEDIERGPILPNTLQSILVQAIRLEYEGFNVGSVAASSAPTVSSVPKHQPASPHQQQQQQKMGLGNSIELNDAERAKLNELIVANKALYAPVDEDLATLISEDCRIKSNQNQHDPLLLKVINLTAIAIRRLIKMSKKISAFKNMCQEDQLALLKAGCTEMMILRSAMQYDCDRASWKIPHSQEEMSNIRADVLKLAKGNVYQEHERFIRTFDKRWRSDENIILIMCAITLFSPDRPKTIHSDVIKLEQNSYYYLLRRYLESIYSGCEARSVFLKLMQKISELHRLNDEIISVYLNVNPAQVEPLLREIFDLKVH